MFSVPTNNDSLFNFFQSQNSIFPFQKSQPQNLLSGSSQNNHSSAKKLNFEEKDEIFVSQFSFSPEKPEKSQPEHDATKKSHELMEIEEESNSPKYKLALKSDESLQSLNKTNKNNFSLLQITVPPKYPKKKEESSAESWQKRNQNIIGLWRNDHHQVFKGKYSSGATPKLTKQQCKVFDSPIVSKKIKTTLFSSNKPPRYSKEAKDFAKENFGDSFNMNLDTEASREKTPSPKKRSYEDHYNTMSIKKERKLFNKKDDLEMNEYYDQEEVRFMTTSKAKIGSLNDIYQSSRFMNDYEISEVIGSGCFGTVYKCLNKFDSMVYAIKCTKNRLKGTKTRNLSLHEAQALASFSSCDENSYIVRYYNAWIEDERLYLVMEHCNYSLKHLKQTQVHFNESQIRHILRDISEGLKSLHKSNVVHLDIKPENILYSKTEKYKISDLGLSRISQRTKNEEISEGDSRYLAPELLLDLNDGNLPDLTKADIFSLGVTIYELMTKEDIPSNGEEWHRIRRLELPKLEKLRNYSETLKRLIIFMLNPNPDLRPSAEQLLVSDFLKSEIQMELQWEKTQNHLYQEKIKEYERILKVKRKKSF